MTGDLRYRYCGDYLEDDPGGLYLEQEWCDESPTSAHT